MIYIQFLWDIISISKEIPNRIDLFIKYLNAKEKLDEKKEMSKTSNRSVFSKVGNFISSINPLRKKETKYTNLN